MRRSRFRIRAAGFSLLEVLVTMVIVALIVTLLMQGLSQALDLRTRLLRHHQLAVVAGLQEQWFRDTVSAAMADLPDALGGMVGSADALEFVTSGALGGQGLQRVRWSLVPVAGGWSLHYSDPRLPELVVIEGPLADASFSYLGSDSREWEDRWEPPPADQPVAMDGLEGSRADSEALPVMVRLRAEGATGPLYWLVPVWADPAMPVLLRPDAPGSGL